jgi:hypothetical protein
MAMRTAIITAAPALALVALSGAAHAQTLPLPPSFPRDAVKTYCAAAGDTQPSIFGGNVGGPAPVEWRCSKGAVLICLAGADGVNCSRRTRSQVPLPSMVAACREPGFLPVASGAMGYVWRWDCRDGKPIIAGPQIMLWRTGETPEKFDAQGYAVSEWTPLR